MGSIRVSDGIVIEFDTPQEGAEIIANLLDKVTGSKTLSKKFRDRIVKSLHEEPALGKRISVYRDRAFEFLKQRGQPMKANAICSSCNIPGGSSTAVFRDKRFERTPDGLMWLSSEGLGLSRTAAVKNGEAHVADLREKVKVFLQAYGRPCYPKKILRHLRLEIYGDDYYFLFRHEMFQFEGGMVWLKGKFFDDINGHMEDPVEKKYSDEELETCRDKIFTYLSDNPEPQRPALIATAIGMDHYLVVAALDHEWFMKSIKKSVLAESGVEGYVIAKRRKSHGRFGR